MFGLPTDGEACVKAVGTSAGHHGDPYGMLS